MELQDYHAEYLLYLQKQLRDLLYVRPYDLKAIEKAGTLLCDSLAMAVEGDCEHFARIVVPDTNEQVWQCKHCGQLKVTIKQ